MYAKIVKYITAVLLLISVLLVVFGAVKGFTANDGQAIDFMLYWAYALVVVAIVAIVVLGIGISAVQDKKNLITILGVLVGMAVIVGVAYVLAPASPAVGLVDIEPSTTELKITDTVLNLTYFACGASVLVTLFSAIYNAIRK